MACIPDAIWEKEYCGMPLWKHVYHMLHSLDLWFINPDDTEYKEPEIHVKDLNNLDVVTKKTLSRKEVSVYFGDVEKIKDYTERLEDEELLRFRAEGVSIRSYALVQHRHFFPVIWG